MESVSLKNFRSLVDTGEIQIKPITLLVGKNSSGKSTFLRTFPLLRQSVESKTRSPILWFGDYVDFGRFEDVVYSGGADSVEMRFILKLREHNRRRGYKEKLFESEPSVGLSLNLVGGGKDGSTLLGAFEVSYFGHSIKFSFAKDGKLNSIFVNNREVLGPASGLKMGEKGLFIPTIVDPLKKREMYYWKFSPALMEKCKSWIYDSIREVAHGKTGDDRIRTILNNITLGQSDEMLSSIKSIKFATNTWKRSVKGWNLNSSQFKLIRDAVVLWNSFDIISALDEAFFIMCNNIKYIAPIRATAERYYRIQDLSVEEVDYKGRNLPMFLRNLGPGEMEDLNDWLKSSFDFTIAVKLAGC